MRLFSRLVGSWGRNGCSRAHPDATAIAHTRSKQHDRGFLIAFCIQIAAVLIATIMERAPLCALAHRVSVLLIADSIGYEIYVSGSGARRTVQ